MASAASRFYYSNPRLAAIGENIGSIFAGGDPADAARARLIESQILGNAADAWQTNSETEILRRRDAALTAAGDALRSGNPDVRAAARAYIGNLVSSGESTANVGDVVRTFGFMNDGVDAGSGIGDTFVMAGGGGYGDTAASFRADQGRLAAAAAAEDATKRRGQDVAAESALDVQTLIEQGKRYGVDIGDAFNRDKLVVDDATARRGQDFESADRRYGTDRTTGATIYDSILDAETSRLGDQLLDAREREKIAAERSKPVAVPMNQRLVTPDGKVVADVDPSAREFSLNDGQARYSPDGKIIADNAKDGATVDTDGDGIGDTFVASKKDGGTDAALKPITFSQLQSLAAQAVGVGSPETLTREKAAQVTAVAQRAEALVGTGMTPNAAVAQAMSELFEYRPATDGWLPFDATPGGFVPRAGAAPAAPPAAAAPAAPPAPTEPTAVNPQTGEVLVFRNGAWVKP